MQKKYYYISLLFLTLLLSNCDKKSSQLSTYFGGKIINPKSKTVILYSQDKVIDTLFLDKANKFFGKLDNVKEGLYYFKHGNENKHFYLEPNDSLLIRLNTWDIDESIVFAGRGAERNNILVDCYLENREDRVKFYNFNNLEPSEFQAKSDSILKIKLQTLNQFVTNHPKETENFGKILKIALTYPLYTKIEKYPLSHSKIKNYNKFPKLTSDFYEFRNEIEFNTNSLMYYPPYSYYIGNYLYNKTYTLGHSPLNTEYTSEFTIDLLNIINDEISSETTKNVLLKQNLIGHFYNKSTCNINKKPFDLYFKLSSNEEDKLQLKNLIDDTKAIDIKEKLPNFNVFDYTNIQHSIKDVIKNRNVLLFFWSPNNVSDSYIKPRMEYLQSNYSNIDFIQIKFKGDIKKSIKNLDIKNQFYIDSISEANNFLTSKMPRTILINKSGQIINGYASIASFNLNPYLEKLNSY